MYFKMPEDIKELVAARQLLKNRYEHTKLQFTFDGKLVGDIGEALAVEIFGIELAATGNCAIDGYAPDKRSVQIKASGSGLGPSFQPGEQFADHLLFFGMNYDQRVAEVIFNGPEHLVRSFLPKVWAGSRAVTINQIRRANIEVRDDQRLQPTGGQVWSCDS
jgi:hypothetical protein